MRALAIAILAACGGAQGGNHSGAPPVEVAEYPALQWAPDAPTYLVAARTVEDGQRAIRDVIDSFGMLVLVTPHDVGAAWRARLGVDPLGPELGATLGVDLHGGVALFSDDLSPTLVVHLAAPAVARAFFDHLRALGMQPTAATVDGVEIETARLADDLSASWAIDGDWLWFHVAIAGAGEAPTAWFAHAHHGSSATPGWRAGFAWAKQLASHAGPLVGLWNNRAILAKLADMMGHGGLFAQATACLTELATVERVGFSIEGDGHVAGGKLAFDLGPTASKIAAAILPPPPGFAALAANAPLAVQWNLDTGAIATGLAPCFAALGGSGEDLTRPGIRAVRGILETFDPDKLSGSGVVAMDLSSSEQVRKLLEEVPKRSLFERDHTFGAYHGKRIAIPFVATVDYVLDDKIALAAMGDGLLDQLVAGPPPARAPLFALDVRPAGLAESTWAWLFEHYSPVRGPRGAQALAALLTRWRSGHVALSIDRDALVLDASGDRR